MKDKKFFSESKGEVLLKKVEEPSQEEWRLYTDGASKGNPGPAGAGWVLMNKRNSCLIKERLFLGEATNNEAEYQALILGLKKAQTLGIAEIAIFLDSELLVRQITGLYQVKNPRLRIYYEQALDLLNKFLKYDITHIPREQNQEADSMANEAIKKKYRSEQPV
jgi:ribonuclease HI